MKDMVCGLKGPEAKKSMARVMLWILFIYMLADDWRSPESLYGWELIFTALLSYVMVGKLGYSATIKKGRPQTVDGLAEDTRQDKVEGNTG